VDRIYNRFKGKTFTQGGYTGELAGFCDGKYILAFDLTQTDQASPISSFRRLDKGSFVEETYKDQKWRYVYINENQMDLQSRGKKKQTYKSILC